MLQAMRNLKRKNCVRKEMSRLEQDEEDIKFFLVFDCVCRHQGHRGVASFNVAVCVRVRELALACVCSARERAFVCVCV